MKNVLSFDAETNGLWGLAFAIGAITYSADGKEISRFIGRCPIDGNTDKWVAENVIPQMAEITITYTDYKSLLIAFMDYYKANKADADIIVHMGLPVEARLFLDAHNMDIIGDWDAPYPIIDISAFPEIHDSVDSYNSKHNLAVPSFNGGTHNPLYDSAAAFIAYKNILGGK